jgi:hypothetical protein
MTSNTGRSSAVSDAAMGAKSAASTAYGSMVRNMTRMGIRPNSGRFMGGMRKWAADRAAIEATARNNAASLARRDQFANQFSIYGAMQRDQNQRTEALARKAEMDAFVARLAARAPLVPDLCRQFGLADSPRSDAAQALQALETQGIRLHLLSGDGEAAVAARSTTWPAPTSIGVFSGKLSKLVIAPVPGNCAGSGVYQALATLSAAVCPARYSS